MLGIDQTILNKIENSQPMKYKLTKRMFRLPPEVIVERENNLLEFQARDVQKKFPEMFKNKAQYIANKIWEVLPLLLKREALNNYANENNDLTMYLTNIPVVDNLDQVIRLLLNEYPNLKSQKNSFKINKTYLTYLPKNMKKNNQSQQQNAHSGNQEHPLKKRARIRIQ